MRIAICLSGLVRTYRQTYDNFCECLLKPNSAHHIDIFISTWTIEHSNISMERTRREAWYGLETPLFPENRIDFAHLQDLYQPISMVVDRQLVFPTPWYVPVLGVNIQSLLSMTYKIYHCDILRRNYEYLNGFSYDAVIRARFDTLFPFPIVINESFNLNVVTVPSMMQEKPYPDRDWVNDKFAVGSRNLIGVYSNWYTNFVPMILRGIPLQPETLLATHLEEANVPYAPWGSEMELIRFM